MARQTESPTGGDRKRNTNVVDAVKNCNSGLETDGGFTRFVQRFNHNDVMRSPTTSSRDYKPQAQKIKINKGIAGKI
jgi:hypothetical protein